MPHKINKGILASIKREAKLRYPNEACGLIVKSGRKTICVPCENTSERPKNNFIIRPSAFADAEDMGEVIAVWHTHVDQSPAPSNIDVHACNALGLSWFIVAINKAQSGFDFSDPLFLAPSGDTADYVGRPYVYGVYDCFTLIKDYYKREFNKSFTFIPEGYPEMEDWHTKGVNLLSDNFEVNGFEVAESEAQIGDIFLIQLGSPIPNHVAIYLGNDRILHHTAGRLSCTDVYGGGYWQKHTTHHLRQVTK